MPGTLRQTATVTRRPACAVASDTKPSRCVARCEDRSASSTQPDASRHAREPLRRPPSSVARAGRTGRGVLSTAPGKDEPPILRGGSGARGASRESDARDHMWSIITCPKPEQDTWVAPGISRAKS